MKTAWISILAGAVLATACSGGRPLVLVAVSLGEPGIAVATVDITATPSSGGPVTRSFDWSHAHDGVLSAGVFLPADVEGPVAVRAAGMDATGAVEATGSVTVQKGKATLPLPLALRRVGSPPPDGGTPPDTGAPPDGVAPDAPPSSDQAPPADTAPPVDVAPVEPPSLSRCMVYEHAGPCELKPTSAGVGIWDLHFSPDGKYLVTCGDDGKARIWLVNATGLVDEGRVLDTGNNRAGAKVAFSADGTRLALGDGNGGVVLYEFPKAISVGRLPDHPAGISNLMFSSDGKRLVTVDFDNTVRLFDLANNMELKKLVLPGQYHEAVLAPAGQSGDLWLAVGFNNMTGFLLANLAKDPVTMVRVDAPMMQYGLAFSPDGNKLALASEDGTMTLWDVTDKQKPVAGPELWPASPFLPVQAAFSPDGRFVTAACSSGNFGVGEIKMGTVQPPGLRSKAGTGSSAMSVDFSPDGRAVATGSWRCGKITYCKDP